METAGLRRQSTTHSKAMKNDEANGCARRVYFTNFIIQPTEYHLLYLHIAVQVGPLLQQPIYRLLFLFIGQSNCLSVLIFWQWVLDANPGGTTVNIKKQPFRRLLFLYILWEWSSSDVNSLFYVDKAFLCSCARHYARATAGQYMTGFTTMSSCNPVNPAIIPVINIYF